MGDGDESTARDMGRFVARCGEIERRYGCLVPLVHHTGKDPSRGGRGSNSLNGALDVTLDVDANETFSRVTVIEMKDGPTGSTWTFRLLPCETSGGPRNQSVTSPKFQTCVVEILSEPSFAKPAPSKTKKVPAGVPGDLFKVIKTAIEDSGQTKIAAINAPAGARGVGRTTLKKYCRSMDWQEPDEKPASFRAMLNKNLSMLRARHLIGFDRDWVWLT
jgi:hypothetical protein